MADHPEASARPTGRGGCPHCGYAMVPELDRVCPRCKKAPDEAAKAPASAAVPIAPMPPVAPLPIAPGASGPIGPTPASLPTERRPATGGRAATAGQIPVGRIVGGAICALMVIAMSAVWFRDIPALRGQGAVLYWEALAKVKSKDFAGARAACTKALQVDEKISEAALMGGMACMEFWTDEEAKASFQQLLTKATNGDTRTLNDCDAWLRECIKRCDKDPDRRPVDRSLRSTARVKSTAQAILGATAMLRGAAAAQAQQYRDMTAWLDVSGKLIAEAEASDPDNPWAESIRGEYEKAQKAAQSIPKSTTPALSPLRPLNIPNAQQFIPGGQYPTPTTTIPPTAATPYKPAPPNPYSPAAAPPPQTAYPYPSQSGAMPPSTAPRQPAGGYTYPSRSGAMPPSTAPRQPTGTYTYPSRSGAMPPSTAPRQPVRPYPYPPQSGIQR